MSRRIPPTLHGDETGLFKQVEYGTEGVGKVTKSFGAQNRELGVDRVCKFGDDNVALGLRNSSVSYWDGNGIAYVVQAVEGKRIQALCNFSGKLVCCSESGKVEIRNWPERELTSSFQTDGLIDGASLQSESDPRLAVGGKNHDLRVWDLEALSIVYRAKNVPNDHLDITVPVWITGTCWCSPNNIATSTAYNQIRFYDVREKRPVRDICLDKTKHDANHHINCIVSVDENTVIVADAYGQISIVDVGKTGRLIAHFKGPKGSVRSLAIHEDKRTLCTGGLDRYVRVFDIPSHKQIGRCYVKQKVNAVCFGALPEAEASDQDEWDFEQDDDEEDAASNRDASDPVEEHSAKVQKGSKKLKSG